ncbi:MAG: UDP-N-acetylglucosamine 1-carboxyvinyltransferase, partial [Dehalococcoidia bacterium]|nr:UDP-N-acetylglucosamine 1-carboxyvinyltransferase [Dehalococcoidia bacterium]
MSAHYVIQGGRPLRGEVTVSGSKNAALYTLPAALLTSEPVTIRNVPRIADIREMAEICESVGSTVEIDGETVRMVTPAVTSVAPPIELVSKLRASFLLMG